MKDRRVQLRVKLKSLAAESRIIRREMSKAKDPVIHIVDVPDPNLPSTRQVIRHKDMTPEEIAESRAEEQRLRGAARRRAQTDYDLYFNLLDHKAELGHEARHTILAMAALKGKPYWEVEQKFRSMGRVPTACELRQYGPNFDRVRAIAQRFGPVQLRTDPRNPRTGFVESPGALHNRKRATSERVAAWIEDAAAYINAGFRIPESTSLVYDRVKGPVNKAEGIMVELEDSLGEPVEVEIPA